jgi:hypothetical protein
MARGNVIRPPPDELGRALTAWTNNSMNFLSGGCEVSLLAESWLHRHSLTALGAPPREHLGAALGLHTRTKTVLLRALTPVGLECALGHETSLLLTGKIAVRQTKSINDAERSEQTSRGELRQDKAGRRLNWTRPGQRVKRRFITRYGGHPAFSSTSTLTISRSQSMFATDSATQSEQSASNPSSG